MKVIDLFCGIGGFSEGFKQAGFEIYLAIDNWELALKSHKVNHPDSNHWLVDIFYLDKIPECDVIIGSPPCTDFSIAKAMQGDRRDPEKGMILIDKMVDLIRKTKPKYWILENVWGLTDSLKLSHIKIDCYDFGSKSHRRRAFFGHFPIPQKIQPFNEPYPTITAQGGGGKWGNVKAWKKMGMKNYALDYNFMLDVMGFPKNYVILGNKTEVKRQIGNAVPPPVAKAIAEAIKNKDGI
jgi:site-specific DNA-cytosine methylase